MKKVASILGVTLMLGVPVNAFAAGNDQGEPINDATPLYEDVYVNPNPFISDEIGKDVLLYSGPIEGAEDLVKPTNLDTLIDDHPSTRMVVNDGGFTWDYDKTWKESDRIVKDGYAFMANAIMTGTSGGIGFLIGKLFGQGLKGAVIGGISKSLWEKAVGPLTQNTVTYWTVKQYSDKDAYSLFTKYDIKVYKDKSRTKLVTEYSEVHSNRYK